MKKLLLIFCVLLSTTVYAATKNDTININQADVSKWEAVEGVNTKGAKTTKYYCVYKTSLVTTTKTTMEKVALCKKLGAKCALICIGKTTKGVFVPKRIVAL